MTTITLRVDERSVTARLDADGAVQIDGQAFTVTSGGAGLYIVSDGRQRWSVAVADDGDTRWVSLNGRIAVIQVDRGHGRTAARRSPRGDALMAPMPATVVKLLVEPGQAVSDGETLLVLEAMKMELPIRAPRAGVVKAISCVAGELVQPGVPLVDME